MGKDSNIAWTDHTWNPWQGCKKISTGCMNCYMYRDKKRFGQDPDIVARSKPATFYKPHTWSEKARVFVCSWSDFFIESADEWRQEAWDIIEKNPHLDFQLLTKRPENILERLPVNWGFGMLNVWLGVTVENQEVADAKIPILQEVDAGTRFLSMEPLLGPVHLQSACNLKELDWVIVGGESGPNARHMDPNWARDIKEQCAAADVPFFMKQMSGRNKSDLEAIPDDLMVREFPEDL